MLLNLSVRNRMSLVSMHCLQDGIWPSKLRKPFNILVHFLDIEAFPLTSLVLGTQKHCSTCDSLVEFPVR